MIFRNYYIIFVTVITQFIQISEYSKFLSRLKTYDTYNYKLTCQHKCSLCEAGFIFSGVKYYVRCFNCGVILKDWETTDNPWKEHALFSPGCTFVLLNKCDEFINKVLNEFKHRRGVQRPFFSKYRNR